jgi:hypothetical protein
VPVFRRDRGPKFSEEVKLDADGFSLIQIGLVGADPPEGFAFGNLQARQVDLAKAEKLQVTLWKVGSDDAD